jgi:leader peptidase (prepilin peptidase)/N-methyltransferase
MIEIYIIALGLIFGSFINVVIYRIPLKKSIVFPRSFCPQCNNQLKFYHNIPVLSFLFQGGKCAYCRSRISFQYPLVEILSALSFYLSYSIYRTEPLHAIFLTIFLLIIIILAFIDLNHMILPDQFTIGGSVLFLLYSFINPLKTPGPVEAFLTGFGTALLFLAIYYFYLRVRKIEGLGLGDIKYVILLGAFLGVKQTIVAIFLASISGLLVGIFLIIFKKKNLQFSLPFGTFLSLGSYLSLFFSDYLLNLLQSIPFLIIK